MQGKNNFVSIKRQTNKGINSGIRCFPYFFLLGFTKSGTTDLYNSLSELRHFYRNEIKEPSFWSRRRFGEVGTSTCPAKSGMVEQWISDWPQVGLVQDGSSTYTPTTCSRWYELKWLKADYKPDSSIHPSSEFQASISWNTRGIAFERVWSWIPTHYVKYHIFCQYNITYERTSVINLFAEKYMKLLYTCKISPFFTIGTIVW